MRTSHSLPATGAGGAVSEPDPSVALTIDRAGLHLDHGDSAVLDVAFEGNRVFSVNPDRDAVADGHGRLVSWPAQLVRYLTGTAHVRVTEHVSGRVLFDGEHAFDDSDTRFEMVDGHGRPLAIDKEGNPLTTFEACDRATVDTLLDAVEKVLSVLRTDGEVDAFLAFGALLGAVRGGSLLPHDLDVDLAYLSSHTNPVDVIGESFRLERVVRAAGWQTWRFSGADFKVVVPSPQGDRSIDVSAGFVVDGTCYLMPTVRTPFRDSMFLPLGEVRLEGRTFPAPADPAGLLEATYGAGWSTPDPSFRYQPEPELVRRMEGWMRGSVTNRNYWWPFYSSASAKKVPEHPSPFAQWVAGQESDKPAIVDVGAGTGRDSLWFSGEGFEVLGMDYVAVATDRAGEIARSRGLTAKFQPFNLYDVRQVLVMGARLAHREVPPTIYGRFLVHALEDAGRLNLWQFASMALRGGGKLYLEFRTGADADKAHEFGEHFRKYLDPATVVAEIEAKGGRIVHREEGYGLAVYKNEDPHVSRLVASWHD